MKKKAKVIDLVVCLLLLAVLMIQNRAGVSVKLFLWDVQMPRIILLLVTLIVGFLSGLLFAKWWERKR